MRVPRFSESAFNLRNWACWKKFKKRRKMKENA